jgi:outer membrane protein OmpA-like peptidoglycan-associated protein
MPFLKPFGMLAGLLLSALHCLAGGDTLGIYFPFNEAVLAEDMANRLDSALVHGILLGSGQFLIIGHTDALGSEGYNMELSRRRAQAVKTFLIGTGVRPAEITLLTGLGERQAGVAANADSRPQDRRVDIVLLPHRRKPQQAPAQVAANARRIDTVTVPGSRRDSAKSVVELKAGESLVLRKVYFYAGRHRVKPESYPALQELLQALIDHPSMRIRVEGHVCCISPEEFDALDEDTRRQELSAIRAMLIEQGVDSRRIEAAGYGYRFPIIRNETNETDADRNRRVEVRILAL